MDNAQSQSSLQNKRSPMRKRPSSGNLSSSINRSLSTLNKFQLKTDVVCHKRSHQNSKLLYICVEPGCKAVKRLGCAHCFLEEHNTHSKSQIEKFQDIINFQLENIPFKTNGAINLVSKLNQLSENLIEKISLDIEGLQEIFVRNLDVLRQKLVDQVQSEIQQFQSTRENIIELQNAATQGNVPRQHVMEMSISEINSAVQLYNDGDQNQSLTAKFNEDIKYTQQYVYAVKETWNVANNQFQIQVQSAFASLKSVNIPPLVKDHYNINDSGFTKTSSCSYDRHPSENCQTQEQISPTQQTQLLNLRQQLLMKIDMIKIYRKDCFHAPQSNLISVFQCCNMAYPCVECHNNLENHAMFPSYPSKRFCLQCLEFFNADCTQEIHIFCPECEQ